VILDIRPVSVMADFFVLATAGSRRQLKMLGDAVAERARVDGGRRPTRVEGEPDSGWVLIDFDDVVVHVFDAERREYYDLEGLWAEAPLVVRMP
jgi:ribosome-associated protein